MRRFASLRREGDFARVRSRGRRSVTPNLTIFCHDAARGDRLPLVGITVSKSVGGAVVRNRVKRRIAACLQEVLPPQAPPRRVVITARPSAAGVSYHVIRAEVAGVLR